MKQGRAVITGLRVPSSHRAWRTITTYAYLVPAAACLGGTVFLPILQSIWMSLYDNVLIRPQDYRFIGLGNYARLAADPVFWLSLRNSVVWTFGSVFFQFIFGFMVALLLNAPFRGRVIFRTINLLPWIIPSVVVGLVFEYLYQPDYGPLNDLLGRTGIMQESVAWLSDPAFAMWGIILANVWRGIPFFAIMILAGLQAIPQEVYEAATVDGADVLQRFWHITIPMLRPIIVVATVTRTIWTFNHADLVFVMTGGGPGNATMIPSAYTLVQAYVNLDWGYAASLSVVLLAILLVCTALYMKVTKGVEEVGW